MALARYRYLVGPLVGADAGTIAAEVPLEGVSWEKALNASGQMSGSIPLDHPKATREILDPGTTAIYVERNGTIVWGGILWTVRTNADLTYLDLGCEGFLSYFRHRTLRSYEGMLNTTLQRVDVYTPTGDVTADNVEGVPLAEEDLYRNVVSASPGSYIKNLQVPATYLARFNIPSDTVEGRYAIAVVVQAIISTGPGGTFPDPNFPTLAPEVKLGERTFQVGGENNIILAADTPFQEVQYNHLVSPNTHTIWNDEELASLGQSSGVGFLMVGSAPIYIHQLTMAVWWSSYIGGIIEFEQVDQLDIVRDFLRHSEFFGYSPHWEFESDLSGIKRDMRYYGYERKGMFDAIVEMAEAASGFDFDIQSSWEEVGPSNHVVNTFRFFYPLQGSRRVNTVFDMRGPGTIQASVDVDATVAANVVDVSGFQVGDDFNPQTSVAMEQLLRYPVLEAQYSYRDIETVKGLLDVGQGLLVSRKKPRDLPSVVVRGDVWTEQFDFSIGDEVRVVVNQGWADYDGWHRILSYSVDVGDDGSETITFQFVQADSVASS